MGLFGIFMNKVRYAIYRDGTRVTEYLNDHMCAVLTGIDRGYFKLQGGGDWDSERKVLRYHYGISSVRLSFPKAPICYEIRKITTEIVN